jgi:glucosamine 6-phosphate synthetase-like amidotransferase/phosphosugar isomerase protein
VCGIAGYSLGPESRVDRTLAAQALLAGIAERGADAVGYAWTSEDGRVEVHKQRSGASALLEQIEVPGHADSALVHVRDYTKGLPSIAANNHPIRHGSVIGIHNGIIANDEEIFDEFGFERADPEMTVDSEAIFALVERTEGDPRALELLKGAVATAWVDERKPRDLHVARAVGRPLWLGEGRNEVFFASTREAIEVLEGAIRMTMRKREFDEGSLVVLSRGRVVERARFRPDRSYEEATRLPAIRAPQERVSCLQRLAVLAAAA